ncbi:MAG: bile acid:sodium symporter [Bacteroidota bacterium]|nr:bile acid:sodium symporter [Bacteroidota bacterium]
MESFFSEYILPATLFIIMLGMGMSLEKSNFEKIILRPKAIIVGVFCQIFLLPFVVFALLYFLDISPYVKVGFIIIVACAGGSATNLITYMLKGNLALSVSLTSINSLLILIALPIIVNIGLGFFLGESANIVLPVGDTIVNIVFSIILPVILGMIIRTYFFVFTLRVNKLLKYLLPLLLLSVFVFIIFFDDKGENAGIIEYLYIVPYALILNILSMLIVYGFSRIVLLSNRTSFTLSIEVGLKNSIIGIFVAKTLLANHEMAMVSVVYGAFTFFSTYFLAYIEKKIGKKKNKNPN